MKWKDAEYETHSKGEFDPNGDGNSVSYDNQNFLVRGGKVKQRRDNCPSFSAQPGEEVELGYDNENPIYMNVGGKMLLVCPLVEIRTARSSLDGNGHE